MKNPPFKSEGFQSTKIAFQQFYKLSGYLVLNLFKNRSFYIFYFIQYSQEILYYFNKLCFMLRFKI